MVSKNFAVPVILMLGLLLGLAGSKVAQDEVDALEQISSTMGAKYWKFNSDSCVLETVGLTMVAPRGSESSIECDCNVGNDTLCHVVKIAIKFFSLPGVLPPELVKLPYIQEIDFAYNYLSGTIPSEWTSLPLISISVTVNRLSGKIPEALEKMTSLTHLTLEANKFSGSVPSVLGNLLNLKTLILSSNELNGTLPNTLSRLTNLTDFRINDNNFNGPIPDFIQNWKQLARLEMHATGLEGPIPSSISSLNKMTELKISDINGPAQRFPRLDNMTNITRVIFRRCNLVGEIPSYILQMQALQLLDVSFNKLVGPIPTIITAEALRFVFLTGNSLSGNVPESILIKGSNIDLSYNNLTFQGPDEPACQNLNLNINLFRSSLAENSLRQRIPCVKSFSCPRYSYCSHINCGGTDETIQETSTKVVYEGDSDVEGGPAKYFRRSNSNWGLSSTGDFLDDNDFQNTRYTATLSSSNLSQLYSTARRSPLSLTYFFYCLGNGIYTVKLNFAEILFTDDNTYSSLGKRIFDIYIQDELAWKDFNIADNANGAHRPTTMQRDNVTLTNNILEIRFAWSGKGTTRIPSRGVYGPLISAISVTSNEKVCPTAQKKSAATAYIIVGVVCPIAILLIIGILWWKFCMRDKKKKRKGLDEVDLQTGLYTLKQIRAATNNFDLANKIGEGGFGPVYRGTLADGSIVAVKQLSSESGQGNREFLNEIGTISRLQHPNLVTLYGCCIEGDQLLLVYEYMENNSLGKALFRNSELKLDWATRFRICEGLARGLAYLHEESAVKIVHRDIKAANILLDGNLNPRISDFGLAKLDEKEKTHISTRVAGTIGYMAPEYALWGHLSYKADVYSFGVVVLEVISGKNNNDFMPSNHCVCLLDWACDLLITGNITELVDEKLGLEYNIDEAKRLIKVALLCTSAAASLRPIMSDAVKMIEGVIAIPESILEPSSYGENMRFKAITDLRRESKGVSTSGSQNQFSMSIQTDVGSSTASSLSTSEMLPAPKTC